jgi:hypothetical protein
MIFFVKDGSVVSALGTTFTGIIGVFIGLDIAVLLKKTSAMPDGYYKHINKHRYIAALIIFSFLMIETFILSGIYKREYDSLYASFGMGFLIVIGGLVAAVEGNKIVTGETKQAPSLLKQQGQTVNGNGNIVAGGDIT